MKKSLFLAIILIWMINAKAENPDKYAYIEPKLIIGFDQGKSESETPSLPFSYDLKGVDLGISVKTLSPINDNSSMIISGYFIGSQMKTESVSKEKMNRFGIHIGLRYYFNK